MTLLSNENIKNAVEILHGNQSFIIEITILYL